MAVQRAQVLAARSGKAGASRRPPWLLMTSARALAGPRPSQRVKVTLLPALPPLPWKTMRVRPVVLDSRTLPASAG